MCKISANWFIGSYVNLHLKIAFKISQPKNRQNLKFWNFKWNFLENTTNDFPIFFSISWPYCCEQNMSKCRKFDNRILGEEGSKKHLPPPPFCTMVLTFNICRPTEFWTPTHSFVQMLACDEMTMWRLDRVTIWLCEKNAPVTSWLVTSWPCDDMTVWQVDW